MSKPVYKALASHAWHAARVAVETAIDLSEKAGLEVVPAVELGLVQPAATTEAAPAAPPSPPANSPPAPPTPPAPPAPPQNATEADPLAPMRTRASDAMLRITAKWGVEYATSVQESLGIDDLLTCGQTQLESLLGWCEQNGV